MVAGFLHRLVRLGPGDLRIRHTDVALGQAGKLKPAYSAVCYKHARAMVFAVRQLPA
jgi:hypothetical protein